MEKSAIYKYQSPSRLTAVKFWDIPLFLPVGWVRSLKGTVKFSKLVPLLGTLFISAFCLSSAMAQNDETTSPQATFLPAPREYVQSINRAKRAVAEERYNDAASELGQLLGGQEGEDYFILEGGQQKTLKSVRGEANAILRTLSPEGREAYELQFGVTAKRLLERGVDDQSISQLMDLIRQYAYTHAGQEASMILGRHYMEQGNPLAAAILFDRLYQDNQTPEAFEPELSLLLAISWLESGREDQATSILLALKERKPNLRVDLGEETIPIFTNDQQALLWLKNLSGQPLLTESRLSRQWLMFRGDPTHTAQMNGDMPIPTFQWSVRLTESPEEEAAVEEMLSEWDDIPLVMTSHPIVVKDTILLRAPERLLAIDRTDGTRKWIFPWLDTKKKEPQIVNINLRYRAGQPAKVVKHIRLRQRLWEDSPYGQISSDGKSVFLLHDLGIINERGVDPNLLQAMAFGWGMEDFGSGGQMSNQLVALDVEAEGKLKWVVGGVSGEDEPKLANTFFLGAPLALMGKLYILAEVQGEIRLVVLNAETGRVVWTQQLAHIEQLTINQDPDRRLVGASPAYSEGLLVCPTGAGAIVGVDLSTRSLLWGYRHSNKFSNMQRFYGQRELEGMLPGRTWSDASVFLHQGRAVITEASSNKIYGLDILSGKELWEPVDRREMIYFACFYKGDAVFVNNDGLSFLNLKTGEITREVMKQSFAAPVSGRGFHTGSHYFLPTRNGELLKIDLDKKEVVQSSKLKEGLGNLISYNDEIFSLGPKEMISYYQAAPLREKVKIALDNDPNDVWALSRGSELALLDGKVDQAVEYVLKAYQLNPENYRTRYLLGNTILSAIEADFSKYVGMTETYDDLFILPDQKLALYRLRAEGWKESGAYALALQELLSLIDYRIAHRISNTSEGSKEVLQIESGHKIHYERWLQTQVSDLVKMTSGPEMKKIHQMIEQRLQEAIDHSDIESIQNYVLYFSEQPIGEEVKLLLARHYLDGGHYLRAEFLLLRLQESSRPEIAAMATGELVRLFAITGYGNLAREELARLEKNWGPVTLSSGKTGRELANSLRLEQNGISIETSQSQQEGARWPFGKYRFSIGEEPLPIDAANNSLWDVTLLQEEGPLAGRLSLFWDRQKSLLIVRDENGHDLRQMVVADSLGALLRTGGAGGGMKARLYGHLLVVSFGREIVAYDLFAPQASSLRVSPLWRVSAVGLRDSQVAGRYAMVGTWSSNWGKTRYLLQDGSRIGLFSDIRPAGLCYQQEKTVYCIDPITGSYIWERGGMAPAQDYFSDDNKIFMVADRNSKGYVYRILDGTFLGQRTVATERQRVLTVENKILQWQGENLALYDPWEEKIIWERQLSRWTRGAILNNQDLAIIDPSKIHLTDQERLDYPHLDDEAGRIQILDIDTGNTKITKRIEPLRRVITLYSLESEDHYYLLPDTGDRVRREPKYRAKEVSADLWPVVYGKLHCFDRKTGAAAWQSEAEIQEYGFPINHPKDSPVLVFCRVYQPRLRSGVNLQTTSVLVLDRRTGGVVLDRDDISQMSKQAHVRTSREKNLVEIRFHGEHIQLELTSKAVSPTVPAQTGDEATYPLQRRTLKEQSENAFLENVRKKELENHSQEPIGTPRGQITLPGSGRILPGGIGQVIK